MKKNKANYIVIMESTKREIYNTLVMMLVRRMLKQEYD